MNFHDVRDLLWLSTVCYGASFLLGIIKTRHRFPNGFQESPFVLILLGFVLQTRALYLRALKFMGVLWGMGSKEPSSFSGPLFLPFYCFVCSGN